MNEQEELVTNVIKVSESIAEMALSGKATGVLTFLVNNEGDIMIFGAGLDTLQAIGLCQFGLATNLSYLIKPDLGLQRKKL
jgi:hypothetical protein